MSCTLWSFYTLPFSAQVAVCPRQCIMLAHIQTVSWAVILIYNHMLGTNIRQASASSIILLISLHTVRCNPYCIFYFFFSPPLSSPSSHLPPSPTLPLPCFKSPWMEPGLRCTIFPATVAVVLGPVQPHYFWEPNSHGPRNRRASSAFLALFPGIVSFVTSRAAFQPVNVCAGRSKFPVFSFRKGNLKFRMQPLFFSFSVNYVVFFPSSFFYVFHTFFFVLCCETVYIQRYNNAINLLTSPMLFVNVDQSKENIIPPTTTGSGWSWQRILFPHPQKIKCFRIFIFIFYTMPNPN